VSELIFYLCNVPKHFIFTAALQARLKQMNGSLLLAIDSVLSLLIL